VAVRVGGILSGNLILTDPVERRCADESRITEVTCAADAMPRLSGTVVPQQIGMR